MRDSVVVGLPEIEESIGKPDFYDCLAVVLAATANAGFVPDAGLDECPCMEGCPYRTDECPGTCLRGEEDDLTVFDCALILKPQRA